MGGGGNGKDTTLQHTPYTSSLVHRMYKKELHHSPPWAPLLRR